MRWPREDRSRPVPRAARGRGHSPVPLTAGQAAWIRDVMACGIEKTACPARDAPFTPLLKYLEARLDTRIHSAKALI